MEQKTAIQKAIRSSNLNTVIIAAVVLVSLVILVGVSGKTLYNHFFGPFDVANEELTSIQGPGDTFRTYVTTHPEASLDTGFYYYEEKSDGSEEIQHSYHALLFGDRLLLVKYPGSVQGDTANPDPVTGKIVKLSSMEQSEVLQALTDEFPNLEEAFLPYMLDTVENNGTVVLAIIGIVILTALAVWSIINLIRRSGNPAKHPIALELSRYGAWEEVSHEIDAQMAEPHETHGSNFHLTRDWLVYQTKTRFNAVPYRDLIWDYLFQINNRSYGIVTSRSYNVLAHDRYGKTIQLPYGNKSEVVVDLLARLQKHAPWAYAGFSDELQNAWNKDREGLIASVDARRQAIEASPASGEQPEPAGDDGVSVY